jgi:hypothetical protein
LMVAAVGLGLAGLDPAGALIAVAALAAGARDRSVLAYGVVAILGTVLVGTVLSLGIGTELAQVDWLALLPVGRLAAIIEIALGVGLLVWAVVRLTRRTVHAPKPRRVRAGTAGLISTGALFALSAVLDPTFVAVTVLAGRGPSPVAVVVAQLLWAVISQAPLVFLLVAIARGGHQAAVERFTRWWDRIKPALRWIVTIALLLIGITLVTDAIWWFATGDFLLPEP